MNAEWFVSHYERIADAPVAIDRLRRFILDLAVRGRLVAQDPEDEVAPELQPPVSAAELHQADLPSQWRRAIVGDVLNFKYGKGMKASERKELGPVPVYGSNGIVGFTDQPLTTSPSIIVGRKGSAGALNLCDGPSWTTDVAYYVEPPAFLDLHFLLIALQTLDLDQLGKGVKPGLSRSDAYEMRVCIPPLVEQLCIVAKVDELMALCDQLEAERAEREATRDRLTAASFARLSAPDSETFHSDAGFMLDALPELTARPDQIKTLRKTILDLAVQGKLVSQDPADEPASELLKRIAAEKEHSRSKGRRRGGRTRTEDFPFTTPPGWVVSTLGEVTLKITDGAHKTPTYVMSGVPFVSVKDFSAGRLDLSNTRFITPEEHFVLYKRCDPRRGDILLARIGTLGRAVVVDTDTEFSLFVSVGLIRFNHEYINPDFLQLLLNSPLTEREFDRIKIGGGTHTNKLNLGDLQTVAIPLPPLAEQKRIVAKLDELTLLCDQIEACLNEASATRSRLLDAVIADALAPTRTNVGNTIADREEVLV